MTKTRQLCRLCLSDEKLLDVFDGGLENACKLRHYVVLCTGVEIKETDNISKLICHSCCSLAIEVYKFRQIALANDKSLKELNQLCDTIPPDKAIIQSINDSISKVMSKTKILISTKTDTTPKVNEPRDEIIDETNLPNVNIIERNETSNIIESTSNVIEKNNKIEKLKITIPKNILSKSQESQESESSSSEDTQDNGISGDEEVLDSEDDIPVASLKRKYRSARVNKMFQSRLFNDSDSESDSEPISKKNKFSKYYMDDDYNTDTDSDEIDFSDENPKERLRPQRVKSRSESRISEQPKKPSDQKISTEPYSKYCEYCDRYFWGTSQLKAHQRVHFRCIFCTKGFESYEILQEHMVNVCYKTIINQKTCVLLERVDQNEDILQTYPEAFENYFQNIVDGVYGNPELINTPSLKYLLYHTKNDRQTETNDIKKIFEKFSHLDNSPVRKNSSIQTKRVPINSSHSKLANIVLDDAKSDLNLFNIPIQFIVDKMQSAYISFAKLPREEVSKELWPDTNIKRLEKKSVINFPSSILVENEKNINNEKLPKSNEVNSMVNVPKYVSIKGSVFISHLGSGGKPQSKITKKVSDNINTKVVDKSSDVQNVNNSISNCEVTKTVSENTNLTVSNIDINNLKQKCLSALQKNPPPSSQNGIVVNKVVKNGHPIILNTLLRIKSQGNNSYEKSLLEGQNMSNVPISGPSQGLPKKLPVTQNVMFQKIPPSQLRTYSKNKKPDEPVLNISNSVTLEKTYEKHKPNILRNKKFDLGVQNKKSDLVVQNKSDLLVQNKSDLVVQNKSDLLVQNKSDLLVQNKSDLVVQNKSDFTIQNKSDLVVQNKSDSIAQNKKPDSTVENNLDPHEIMLRNMLENISDEISIQHNYRKSNQSISSNSNNNNEKNVSSNSQSSSSNLNFSNNKPNQIGKQKTYPRPMMIKEEPPIDEGNITTEQLQSEYTDFFIKEEPQLEDQNYSNSVITDDSSYSPNLYQNTPQVNFSAGYSQQHQQQNQQQHQQQNQQQHQQPLGYQSNHTTPYYRAIGRATNHPGIRNRFPTTQPYRLNFQTSTQINMYHPRINQSVTNIIPPTIPSNALVPTNSFQNNFLPNTMYRNYGSNYNNYNNMYQTSYQTQYRPYNPPQAGIDFNSSYPDPTSQQTDTKFMMKQPWEMYR